MLRYCDSGAEMTIERRDIEEVGEAVEALGIMFEEALGGIHERLAGLQESINQMKTEEQSFKEELLELKEKMARAGETF
jgi:hypothetical protein